MNQKLGFLCFLDINNSLLSFLAKLGYSRIKIDHIADSLLKDAVLTAPTYVFTPLSLLSLWVCAVRFSVACLYMAVHMAGASIYYGIL